MENVGKKHFDERSIGIRKLNQSSLKKVCKRQNSTKNEESRVDASFLKERTTHLHPNQVFLRTFLDLYNTTYKEFMAFIMLIVTYKGCT